MTAIWPSNLTNIRRNLLYISYIRDELSEKTDERPKYLDEDTTTKSKLQVTVYQNITPKAPC